MIFSHISYAKIAIYNPAGSVYNASINTRSGYPDPTEKETDMTTNTTVIINNIDKLISPYVSVVDVRDIIHWIEDFRYQREMGAPSFDIDQLQMLESLMMELAGMSGDVEWEGGWYPQTLINSDYFIEYAQNLARDCDLIDEKIEWPHSCIDWEKAARELKYDYSAVECNGASWLFQN